MPIYEYACSSCEKTLDVLQKVTDPAPQTCTECGATGTLAKVVSRTSFVLKGGGWYSDLYSSSKKDGGSGGKKESTGGAANSDSTSTSTPTSTPTPSSTAAPAPKAAAAVGDKK
jgi:putative FmdB family regulatory protein